MKMYMVLDGDRWWTGVYNTAEEAKAAFLKFDEYDQKYGRVLEMDPDNKLEQIVNFDWNGERLASLHYGNLKRFL